MSRRRASVLAVLLAATLPFAAPLRGQEGDPAPAAGGLSRNLLSGEGGVRLDPQGSVVEFRLVPFPADLHMLREASFPSFEAAAKAAEKLQIPLIFSTDATRAVFEEYANGLLGGLRLVLGNGNGNEIQGKTWLLHQLLERLVEKRNAVDAARREPCDLAVVHVAAALMAGGQAPPYPAELETRVRESADAVGGGEPDTEPYGYLLRHADLKHLHRLDLAAARGLAIDSDAGLLSAVLLYDVLFRRQDLDYEIRVLAQTTQALVGPTPQLTPADFGAVFKPGDSFENLSKAPAKLATFRERLFAHKEVAAKKAATPDCVFQLFPALPDFEHQLARRLSGPETAGFQNRLVDQARSEAGLGAAKWNGGWLATQAGVLETFYRRPRSEAGKVAPYAEGLDDIGREEFAPRAVPPPDDGSAPPVTSKPDGVVPPLRLEPAPEYYRVAARAFRSLRESLIESLGGSVLTTLARIEPNGHPSAVRANTDLQRLERLFYGLYALSCQETGLVTDIPADELPALELDRARDMARSFTGGAWNDLALTSDTRVGVPIERRAQEGKSRVRAWGCLGVRLIPCEVRYLTPPKAYDIAGKPAQPKFAANLVLLPVRIFRTIEVEGDRFLTPEAYRQYCSNTYKTPNLKLLARTETAVGSKYSMILMLGCGVGFALLVLGSGAMWYVKRQMAD